MDDFKTNQDEYLKNRQEQKFKRRIEDMKAVIKTPQGRRLIFWLLEQSGYFDCGFIQDSNRMYYFQGRREIGKAIIKDLEIADPTSFSKMQFEAYSERKSEEIIANKLHEKDIQEGSDINNY